MRILVVDDDHDIRNLLAEYLQDNGIRASTAANGKEMWRVLDETPVDLIVLDLNLPGEDGLSLCRTLQRMETTPPVIMLTARSEAVDRIVGLEVGADDYLGKPFEPRELLARIRSVLRRSTSSPSRHSGNDQLQRLYFAGWALDLAAQHLISPQGKVVMLSRGEFRLLKVLTEHPQRVLSRDQLLSITQGREAEPFDRSIDLQISRLRSKLGDDARSPALLKTIRSGGYMLAANVSNQRGNTTGNSE